MYPPQPYAEQVLHQDPNVTVTTARFVVNGTTYPIRGLTAVQYVELPASYTSSIAVLLGGVGAGLFGAAFNEGSLHHLLGWTAGGAVLAIATAQGMKPTFVIRVVTAAGQADVFTSHDKARSGAIATALNRAIAGG